MWKRVFKFLCLLTLAGNIQAYTNSDEGYSHRNSKTAYINQQLQRFRQSNVTPRPRTLSFNKSYPSSSNYRKYPNSNLRNVPVTESPVRFETQHKFRHTRFPKMDGLINRISRLDSDNKDKKSWSSRWPTTENPFLRHAIRTTTETSDIFEDSDDSDFEDDKKSDDSADWDDDDDDDEDDEEEDEDDEDNAANDEETGWQAEEATEAPERSFTEYKWKHYGTRGRVEESRKNHGIMQHSNEYKERAAAVQHAIRVNREAGCRYPKAKIVAIQSVYPDTSKTYIPHCTILHQCGDDTGCCRLDSMTCTAKYTERVELFFYTSVVGRQGNHVEKFIFYNHTECECIERSSIMSNDRPASLSLGSGSLPKPTRTPQEETQLAPATVRRCHCPELYTPHVSHDGHCRCDCTDGHRDCIRIKRGKEYFSLKDRLCIQRSQCGYPSCDFGVYMRHMGRCPKRQEKIDDYSRIITK